MNSGSVILLVDDSPRIRPLVRAILGDLDCQILEAATAEEALDLAGRQSSDIDLLVTDITMPGMSGLELGAQLRRRYPALRILYMSGYALPSATSKGVQFIEKPFRPEALLGKVRDLLNAT